MKSMKNNKTHSSDGLTKVFYKNFWDGLKNNLIEVKKKEKQISLLTSNKREA